MLSVLGQFRLSSEFQTGSTHFQFYPTSKESEVGTRDTEHQATELLVPKIREEGVVFRTHPLPDSPGHLTLARLQLEPH